jgi:hypothetical protein
VVVPFGAVQLTATLADEAGNVLSGRTVSWSSSDAGIAHVSGAGLVTGVTRGDVTITAAAEGKSGSASIRVKDGKAVGPSGGVISGLGGVVHLFVPPRALAQLTNITIEAAQGLPADPRLVPGSTVEIGPSGTVRGVGVTARRPEGRARSAGSGVSWSGSWAKPAGGARVARGRLPEDRSRRRLAEQHDLPAPPVVDHRGGESAAVVLGTLSVVSVGSRGGAPQALVTDESTGQREFPYGLGGGRHRPDSTSAQRVK